MQQQLMEVVQTWEKEAASREEAVRVEMEKGFSMRLAAEREMAERQRKTEMRLAEEAFEVEISRCMQALNEKMTANHKNEIVELKQRLTSETMMKVSRQKNEYDDLLRDLKDEVDTALKKIKFKEEELNSREADLKIQQAELRREREGINEQKNELQVRHTHTHTPLAQNSGGGVNKGCTLSELRGTVGSKRAGGTRRASFGRSFEPLVMRVGALVHTCVWARCAVPRAAQLAHTAPPLSPPPVQTLTRLILPWRRFEIRSTGLRALPATLLETGRRR